MSMRDIDRSKKHFTPYSKLLPVLIYSRLKINKKNICTSFQSRSMFLFEIQQFELPSFHNAWHYNIGMLSRWEKVSPLDFQQRNIFYRKSELWMFLLISGGHVGTPKWYINNYGVSIQSSTKLRETFWQTTQKLWATKTWDLDKLFVYMH